MSHDHIAVGQRVLDIEARAVDALKASLDNNFAKACDLMLRAQGRIIVTAWARAATWAANSPPPLPALGPRHFLSTLVKPPMATWA